MCIYTYMAKCTHTHIYIYICISSLGSRDVTPIHGEPNGKNMENAMETPIGF